MALNTDIMLPQYMMLCTLVNKHRLVVNTVKPALNGPFIKRNLS